ncbi:MAG TPA: hypothetical protein VFN48_03375 [Solirubrobacteraceae bacterium]|nr:hypothetical protein [Solirubrobacteraceae bacterium]
MRRRQLSAALVAGALTVASGLGGAVGSAAARARPRASADVAVRVGAPVPVAPVSRSFLGLSLEYYELPGTLGGSVNSLNPIFPTLVKLLNPSGLPSLRIGGESADWIWLPTRGVKRAAPLVYTLTPALESVLAAEAHELNARYVLDLNLAANSDPLAIHEADSLVSTIGSRYIRALEIGNEPDLYGSLSWSRPPLAPIYARPGSYGFNQYLAEFNALARGLPRLATAGPASGQSVWSELLAAEHSRADRLGLVTVHRYALQKCGLSPQSPKYPTVQKLLEPSTAFSLAGLVAPLVRDVHAHHLPLRVDELNSAPCFGVPGVSNTFASALWALQSAFALAETGVDGINVHTVPAAAHRLFNFWQTKGTWHGSVFPEFYGFEMFSLAAPAGAQLLRAFSASANVTAWATRSTTTDRVVLVNTGARQSVTLNVPGAHGPAFTLALRAGSPKATSGITLGDTEIPTGTTTGAFATTPAIGQIAPSSGGRYLVTLPADSALLLTLARSAQPVAPSAPAAASSPSTSTTAP